MKINVNVILIVIGILISIRAYARAVRSRKIYKCSECGESFRVELMEASHCKVCGAPVNLSNISEVSDKSK